MKIKSQLNPTGLDAYKPAEIAVLMEAAGTNKTQLPFVQMSALALLAGAFISVFWRKCTNNLVEKAAY